MANVKTASRGLVQFIKHQCANWERGNGCTGCMPNERTPFNSTGKCLITEGWACVYFERYILPHPDYPQRPARYDYGKIKSQYLPRARKRKYFGSVKEYEQWHTKGWGALVDSPDAPTNYCNDCDTGIPPKKRYCEECRVKRNRASKRDWKRKMGSKVESCGFKKPSSGAKKRANKGVSRHV